MVAFNRSEIPAGAVVIDDNNFRDWVRNPIIDGEIKGRGLVPRLTPKPKVPFMAPLDMPLIPRVEWKERIEERERKKMRGYDFVRQNGIKCKNQASTNYCWINAPTHCIEIIRAKMGLGYVSLSPASAGGPIKNFRNSGGWGTEGVKWMAEKGVCPSSVWPDNAIQSSYYTAANKELALNFRIVEFWDLRDRSLDELFTLLFAGIPVACGYNWWSHEVTGLDPLYFGGDIANVNTWGLGINNSWGPSYGDNGYGVLKGSKAVPDDQCAPRSIVPWDGDTLAGRAFVPTLTIAT